jgi:hypothetical protein
MIGSWGLRVGANGGGRRLRCGAVQCNVRIQVESEIWEGAQVVSSTRRAWPGPLDALTSQVAHASF